MAGGGLIGFFDLTEWWLLAFTPEERDRITLVYRPLGAPADYLAGRATYASSQTKLSFLTGLAAWLRRADDRHLAFAFLEKAEGLFDASVPAIDRHFALSNRCQVYYRWRDVDDFALPRAIDACRRSVAIHREAAAEFRKTWPGPLPRHACFQQFAIIEEKRGNFAGAILLCDQAEAEGWGGDWTGRRKRLRRKWDKALRNG